MSETPSEHLEGEDTSKNRRQIFIDFLLENRAKIHPDVEISFAIVYMFFLFGIHTQELEEYPAVLVPLVRFIKESPVYTLSMILNAGLATAMVGDGLWKLFKVGEGLSELTDKYFLAKAYIQVFLLKNNK